MRELPCSYLLCIPKQPVCRASIRAHQWHGKKDNSHSATANSLADACTCIPIQLSHLQTLRRLCPRQNRRKGTDGPRGQIVHSSGAHNSERSLGLFPSIAQRGFGFRLFSCRSIIRHSKCHLSDIRNSHANKNESNDVQRTRNDQDGRITVIVVAHVASDLSEHNSSQGAA